MRSPRTDLPILPVDWAAISVTSWDDAQRYIADITAERDTYLAVLREIVEWDCPEGWGGAGFAHVRQLSRLALDEGGER
jgi:hypothetical protein